MVIGIATFELHIPGARSLKEKRKVVKSLIDRIHRRYRVSVAETGLNELHQRSEITVALVDRGSARLDNRLEELRRLAESDPEARVSLWQSTLLEDVHEPSLQWDEEDR